MNNPEWWDAKGRRYFRKGDFRDRPFEFKAMAARCVGPVIELGCAFGMFSSYLPSDMQYLGVDWSPFMLDHARKLHRERLFAQADIWHLLASYRHAFTTVVAMQLLEHFPDPDAVIEKLKQLSRGCVLLNVPRGPLTNASRENDGHVWQWLTDDAFGEMLSDHGKVVLFAGASNHICGELTW